MAENGPEVEIYRSGPLRVAEIDCHRCDIGLSTLNSPSCRECVFSSLGGEDELDWVILKRGFSHVYMSKDLWNLARALASLSTMVGDRAQYLVKEEDGRCSSCVDRRKGGLESIWSEVRRSPHDLSSLDRFAERERNREMSDECAKCTSEKFLKLISSIKAGLATFPIGETSPDYDEAFDEYTVPFFVRGVWKPLEREAELIDSYPLADGRGQVRIYSQEDRPVMFYELDLPEMDLPAEHIELLDKAHREKFGGAPSHARFAKAARVTRFTKDWYSFLLHVIRDREEVRIPSDRLRELADRMASWLRYSVLEPLAHDEHITDIYFTAPPEEKPVTIVHDKWGKCETGFYVMTTALASLGEILAADLDRSFDEANPRLDAEIPDLGMRLFMTRPPALWTDSVAAMARRRRARPWTQPLFIEKGTLTPLASAVLSHFLRFGASGFITGDIGTAKTSCLETLVPEIGPQERIVCFQDTEELHVEDFLRTGHEVENVRVRGAEDLQEQINAFLRGGAAYWLITEVRETDAVKAALGAAARRGAQPVLSSFHVRTKRKMFDLVCNIMGLHKASYKHMDLFISTAKFDTPEGSIRRITEISEVLKDWDERPEYATLFSDDRREDLLRPRNLFSGDRKIIEGLSQHDLSKVDVLEAADELEFLPPEEGGSRFIPGACDQRAIDPKDLLTSILAEARMKSDLLQLYRRSDDLRYLELPFVSRAYDYYSSAVQRHSPDYGKVLTEWNDWLP